MFSLNRQRLLRVSSIMILLLLFLGIHSASALFKEKINLQNNRPRQSGSVGSQASLLSSFGTSKQNNNDLPSSESLASYFITALKRKEPLRKDSLDFLRWLDVVGTEPSCPLARHKRIKKNVLMNETATPPKVQQTEILDHMRRLIDNPRLQGSRNQTNIIRKELSRKELQQKQLLDLLSLTNDSSTSDPLASGRRYRRYTTVNYVDKADAATVHKKLLDLMMQAMYSAQERLAPLDGIVRKYQNLAPYRMAIVFRKLDQLVQESHSILVHIEKAKDDKTMDMTKRLQLYSQLLRRNVDVTYTVDYLLERVPFDQVVRGRQHAIRVEQEKLLKAKIADDKTMDMTKRLQLYSQLLRRNVDVTYTVDYLLERVPFDQVVRGRQHAIRVEQEKLLKAKIAYDKTTTQIFRLPPKQTG